MKIQILSKRKFDDLLSDFNISDENIEYVTKYAFISINDTIYGTNERPVLKENHYNALVMHFDDVDRDYLITILGKPVEYKAKAMTQEQALEIVEFIKRHKDRNFIIHCQAGISRSAAIGKFINEKVTKSETFESDNPHISPSEYVYNLLVIVDSLGKQIDKYDG